MNGSESIPTTLFATAGSGNTDATLRLAAERATDLGIDRMVIATSTGKTALRASEVFAGQIIAVTLSAGHWETYCPPDPAIIARCEEAGVKVLTSTHTLLGGIDGAVSSIGGLAASEIIGRTYYTICQGAKVAVECLLMAADAGLIEMDREAIGIAGTGGGADTAIVVTPAFSNTFFDLRIREIIAKPR